MLTLDAMALLSPPPPPLFLFCNDVPVASYIVRPPRALMHGSAWGPRNGARFSSSSSLHRLEPRHGARRREPTSEHREERERCISFFPSDKGHGTLEACLTFSKRHVCRTDCCSTFFRETVYRVRCKKRCGNFTTIMVGNFEIVNFHVCNH